MAGPGFLAMRDLQSRAENVLLILSKRGATVPRIPAELSGTVALWRSWPGVEKDLRQKTSFLGWLFFCLGLAVGLPLCVLSAVAMFVSVKEYAAELAVLHVIGLPTGRIFLHTLAGYALPVFIGILAGALTGGGAGYLLIARLITGTGLSPGIYPTTAVAILALFLAMVLVAAAVIWRATAARDPIMAIESGREVLGGLLA